MTRKKLYSEISTYAVVAFGAILMALNYQLFVVENGFSPAVLNGIATMIQYKTGFSIGYMSLIINIPLCILAYLVLDRSFARRSLIFSLIYAFVFLYLQHLGLENLQYRSNGSDTIFPVMLSGVIDVYKRQQRVCAMVLTYLITLILIVLFVYAVVPHTARSVTDLSLKIRDNIPRVEEWVSDTLSSSNFLRSQVNRLEDVLSEVMNKSLDIVQWLVSYATSIVVETTNILIGLIPVSYTHLDVYKRQNMSHTTI